MRKSTQSKPAGRQQVSNIQSYAAPVGGLNATDSIADMPPTDALALTNWFPKPAYCEIRGGYASHVTGFAGNTKNLVVYNSLTGSNKMFCANATGVYDVSSAGAVGASVAARTVGNHQWLMFGDGTSNWLIMVNGTDKPLYYDGTTWTAVDGVSVPALTGVTTTNLIGVAIHKGRLMFVEKNSLSFWYLAAGAAGGALSEFDLSGVAQKGGYLMAAMSWTVDAGSGPDDRMTFVTSEGEVIVYQGTNPGAAANWSLVGVYTLGKPIGRRCMNKINSDLVIMTQNGVFSLSTILQESGVNYSNAISKKIENVFNDAARTYSGTIGWCMTVLPAQSAFIVNVPIAENGEHIQYVMNTITKSWCKFTGWNAEDFAVFNGYLYFCSGTAVYKAWTGASDNGANIQTYAKTAFNYFKNPNLLKKFKLFRPVLSVNGSVGFLTDIDTDFKDETITGVANYTVTNGGLWDSAIWDASTWGYGLQIVKEWLSPDEWAGYCAAGKIKLDTNTLTVQWLSCDYVYESGGIL